MKQKKRSQTRSKKQARVKHCNKRSKKGGKKRQKKQNRKQSSKPYHRQRRSQQRTRSMTPVSLRPGLGAGLGPSLVLVQSMQVYANITAAFSTATPYHSPTTSPPRRNVAAETEKGFVYAAYNPDIGMKIGMTKQSPEHRIRSFNTAVARDYVLVDQIATTEYKLLERYIHHYLREFRVGKKEIFRVSPEYTKKLFAHLRDRKFHRSC